MRTDRIEGLTDGIFAIAMTLLVLELKVPHVAGEWVLGDGIVELVPHLLTYALSFIVLGILWIGHHNQLNFIQKSDRTFLWLNIFFFALVALIPYSAEQLAAYPLFRPAVVFYALNLSLCSFMLLAVWNYAYRHQLTVESVDARFNRLVRVRILTSPAFYLFAILIAAIPGGIAIRISLLLFVLPVLASLFPGRIDRLFER